MTFYSDRFDVVLFVGVSHFSKIVENASETALFDEVIIYQVQIKLN